MMWGWLSLQIFGWKFVSCPFLSYKLESGGRLAAWSLVRHLCETRWGWLSLPLELSETFVWADKFKLGIRETFVWADAFELAFWYLDGNLCPVPFDREVESGGRFAAWSLVRHFCEARWEWLSLPLELSETFVWADTFDLEFWNIWVEICFLPLWPPAPCHICPFHSFDRLLPRQVQMVHTLIAGLRSAGEMCDAVMFFPCIACCVAHTILIVFCADWTFRSDLILIASPCRPKRHLKAAPAAGPLYAQ